MPYLDKVTDSRHRVSAWNKMQKIGNLIVLNGDYASLLLAKPDVRAKSDI